MHDKLLMYRLKDAKDYQDHLAIDEFELEHNRKVLAQFKDTPFHDIRYSIETRVKLSELSWQFSSERLRLIEYSQQAKDVSVEEFVTEIEKFHENTQAAIRHFIVSESYLEQKRQEYSDDLQLQNLSKEDRIILWSYIGGRINRIEQSIKAMQYDKLAEYMQVVLKLHEFILERKDGLKTSDGEILFRDLSDMWAFRQLQSDVQSAARQLTRR